MFVPRAILVTGLFKGVTKTINYGLILNTLEQQMRKFVSNYKAICGSCYHVISFETESTRFVVINVT